MIVRAKANKHIAVAPPVSNLKPPESLWVGFLISLIHGIPNKIADKNMIEQKMIIPSIITPFLNLLHFLLFDLYNLENKKSMFQTPLGAFPHPEGKNVDNIGVFVHTYIVL